MLFIRNKWFFDFTLIGLLNFSDVLHKTRGLSMFKGVVVDVSNLIFIKSDLKVYKNFFIRNKWIFEELVRSYDPFLNFLKEMYMLLS